MFPQRLCTTAIAALGLISALPALAVAELSLYKGEPTQPQEITLGSWGSGIAVESQRYNFTGSRSIEVHTDGYYAGGRINFVQPVDLTDAFAERNAYLVMTIKFPGFGDDGEFLGDAPSGYGGGYGGYGRGSVPGLSSTPGATGPKMSFFRIVATVNGQELVAEDQPIDLRRTEAGWTTLSVPLAAFKGNRPSGRAMLSRLVVYGDRPDTFYIGEIRTSVDDAEIFLEESPEEQTISPYDQVQMTALASAGLANVEYVWDFNKEDGIQEEAFGETVYRSYTQPGDYRVTLIVRDINKVKPELREEFLVSVSP
ncbi:MAG: PKD domain-containing protein [Armatimonadetes bacterium]|nr:PKD domain-containing protein [Armatimonadota bacterium]